MKKYMNKRIPLFVMLFVVSMFSLTACGSKEAVESVNETETVAVEAAVVEEASAEVSETEVVHEVVAETVVEETAIKESTEEIYIPEGIDMESTLSGEEWVASFVGKVAEPVVVVFNDNTGRKEVVQANSEVTINPDEDMIATYWLEKNMYSEPYHISVKETYSFDYYEIRKLDAKRLRSIPERDAKMTIKGGTEDWVLEFTIIVE